MGFGALFMVREMSLEFGPPVLGCFLVNVWHDSAHWHQPWFLLTILFEVHLHSSVLFDSMQHFGITVLKNFRASGVLLPGSCHAFHTASSASRNTKVTSNIIKRHVESKQQPSWPNPPHEEKSPKRFTQFHRISSILSHFG